MAESGSSLSERSSGSAQKLLLIFLRNGGSSQSCAVDEEGLLTKHSAHLQSNGAEASSGLMGLYVRTIQQYASSYACNPKLHLGI